jgi:hypothetical protein
MVQRPALGRVSSIPGSSSRTVYPRALDHQPPHDYQSPHVRTSQIEPNSPASHVLQDPALVYDLPPGLPPLHLPRVPTAHDRWERLAVLFRSVHTHALTFDYPDESVNVLESMLVKLYLESPLVGGGLRDDGTGLGMEGIEMGALGDGELGIPGIGGAGINQMGDLDAMRMMEDAAVGLSHARPEPRLHMQSHPHHRLHPH